MAPTSHPVQTVLRGLERTALFILVGMIGITLLISLFLGPVLLFPVMICAVIALGIDQLLRREGAQPAVDQSQTIGAKEPVLWGTVVRAVGHCPTGQMPRPGQRFSVVGDEVRPELCEHMQRAILEEVASIEQRGEMIEGPVRYHDADHAMEFELSRAPTEVRVAA